MISDFSGDQPASSTAPGRGLDVSWHVISEQCSYGICRFYAISISFSIYISIAYFIYLVNYKKICLAI